MSNQKDDVQSHYDRWAPSYATAPNPTRDLNARILREEIVQREGRILEIGCGSGVNTEWLARLADAVVAIDFSEAMIDEARWRIPGEHVEFVAADVTRQWPVDGVFDLVVATLVLEHVRDLGHIFVEAHRVLRPGGRLYIAELHPYKQLQGSQARYSDSETGENILVPAVRHDVSEFINSGIVAGFRFARVLERPTVGEEMPRLLGLWFER